MRCPPAGRVVSTSAGDRRHDLVHGVGPAAAENQSGLRRTPDRSSMKTARSTSPSASTMPEVRSGLIVRQGALPARQVARRDEGAQRGRGGGGVESLGSCWHTRSLAGP
jgi:hypothetical protein